MILNKSQLSSVGIYGGSPHSHKGYFVDTLGINSDVYDLWVHDNVALLELAVSDVGTVTEFNTYLADCLSFNF